MSDNENERDNEVVINVDRHLKCLELAQQVASTQMLDRICQRMEDSYTRIRTDMARQEEALSLPHDATFDDVKEALHERFDSMTTPM